MKQNAASLLNEIFSHDEDDAPRSEPLNKRFKWKPKGDPAAGAGSVQPAGAPPTPEEDEEEAAGAAPANPLLDPALPSKAMSHAEFLAQGGADRELTKDDVFDIANQARGMKGKARTGLNKQVNRLRGYAGFGESKIAELVNDLLDR